MKKVALLILVLFATISFVGCTDLSEDDETLFETQLIDPADDGSIDEEDYWEGDWEEED